MGECLALNPQLTWAVVVDLSNFFFHLGLHPSAGRWIRIKTAMGNFQWTALPFGLHCSPYWTARMAHVVEGALRGQGVHLIWYVDDILVLGTSQAEVANHLRRLVEACNQAGLIINTKKSQLTPSQRVNYLGQHLDLERKIVAPQPPKLQRGVEMAKAYIRRKQSTPANIAGLAGTLLDLQKGNVALHGLAKCIMREAAWMLHGGTSWWA